MPAAQRKTGNREIRFTVWLRRTITIAAGPASSLRVIGPRNTSRHDAFRQPTWQRTSDDAHPASKRKRTRRGPHAIHIQGRDFGFKGEISAPDAPGVGYRSAPAKAGVRGAGMRPGGNKGVGEHVRTRFQAGPFGAGRNCGQLRIPAPNEEELVSSAGPVLEARTFFESTSYRNTIQPFDLMSRRHPLSSTRAFRHSSGALMTCRHQAAGNSWKKRSYFFFFATLRVFLAVFFTALFAFFAFLAFLAMLPSKCK
jgi:hypothetical protein